MAPVVVPLIGTDDSTVKHRWCKATTSKKDFVEVSCLKGYTAAPRAVQANNGVDTRHGRITSLYACSIARCFKLPTP